MPVVRGVGTVTKTMEPSSLVGRAYVIDGDTIETHGERSRHNGIDAPESAQTCMDGNGKEYRCGALAAAALEQILKASSPSRLRGRRFPLTLRPA